MKVPESRWISGDDHVQVSWPSCLRQLLTALQSFKIFLNFSFAHAGFTSYHPLVLKYRERQFQFSAG